MPRSRYALISLSVLLPCGILSAQNPVDLSTITAIKQEAFERSKVMDHLSYLTDVYGPRLTGSPEFKEAADWAVRRLGEFGLTNVQLEKWGPFGRSWSLQQYAVELLEPRYALLNAAPLAWSASTEAPVTGEVILAPYPPRTFDPNKADENLETYRKTWAGKLRGKIVLMNSPQVTHSGEKPLIHRYADAELADLAKAPEPTAKSPSGKLADLKFPDDPDELRIFTAGLPESVRDEIFDRRTALQTRRSRFFRDEGVLGILTEDSRAHGGMVFAEQAGGRDCKDPLSVPIFIVTEEQYNRMARLSQKKVPVRVRFQLQARTSENNVDAYNIVGEIPGGGKADEIVMVGAHFDSWHTGTGATDNAAGSAVMMEVMRILKASGLKLERTVRIALWSGEEQGLLGSKAYVKEHFGDSKTMRLTSAHAKLSGYFNLDNGGGKIRGVYLQGHDAMRPAFEKWLSPFRDQGVTTISIRNTGGTDHLSFAAIGLPGFQFIQDPMDYGTVTHHSSVDTYDHINAADLMQASAVIAAVVYNAANQPGMLPRMPLPKPATNRAVPENANPHTGAAQ